MAFTDNTSGTRVIKQGMMPVKVTLTDTCEAGDLIGFDGVTSNAWERADANGKVPASLVAGEACVTSGDTITCYKMAIIDGFSGATTGDMVYLADDAGDYAATPASWMSQCVGECVSTTEAFIHPTCQALYAYPTTGTGWAGYIRYELESGRTATALSGGLRIDVKTIATSTPGSDIYGLYIHYQLQQDTAGTNYIVRLEENGSVDQCDGFIALVANQANVPTYVLNCGPNAAGPCWDTSTDCSTAAGHLKCIVGGAVRYINLYSDTPS